MTAAWPELVDPVRLAAWMDEAGLGRGPLGAPETLAGGTQNVLLRFRRDGRDYVLRRPPRHPRMDGSTTMRREARMLAALAGTDVPHPRLIAACPDGSVLGAAFYLMEPVDGFNAVVALPRPHRSDPALRRRMGFALVEGIARLGRVDHAAAGLSGFGKVEGYLERQVPRWRAQLESYHEYEGWPGPATLPGIDEVGAWLDANRPTAFRPGIMHGDYHLANVLYRHDGPELAAIVDWELTTIGDPLIDLGWLLASWPEDDGATPPGGFKVEPWDGFPRASELVAHYAALSDRDLSAIGWYGVLACYKLGIILEGTYARAAAGKAPAATGERLHTKTIGLLARALAWVRGGLNAAP